MTVPPGTFTATVQVVCSTGIDSAAGIGGDTVEVFFAIQIDESGATLPGPFTNPIGLTVSDPAITAGATVFEWNPATATYAATPAGEFTTDTGSTTGSFMTDPGFEVGAPAAVTTSAPSAAAPSSAAPSTVTPSTSGVVPGATTAVTGQPFVGEGAAAAGLIGLGGLGAWRWRRAARLAARRR